MYCWPNGTSYEGEWVNGVRHGKGVLNSQILRYEGDFIENKMQGTGQ